MVRYGIVIFARKPVWSAFCFRLYPLILYCFFPLAGSAYYGAYKEATANGRTQDRYRRTGMGVGRRAVPWTTVTAKNFLDVVWRPHPRLSPSHLHVAFDGSFFLMVFYFIFGTRLEISAGKRFIRFYFIFSQSFFLLNGIFLFFFPSGQKKSTLMVLTVSGVLPASAF